MKSPPTNEIGHGGTSPVADGLPDYTSPHPTAAPGAPQPTVATRRHRLPCAPAPSWPYAVEIERDDGRVTTFTRCSDRDHAAQTVERLRRVGIVGRIVRAAQ